MEDTKEDKVVSYKVPDGLRMNQKAMEILGTTPTKLILMKTLGISPVELDKVVEDMEVHSIEQERGKKDKTAIKIARNNSKCFTTLGVDPSFYTLQKQLGVSGEELEKALLQVKEYQELAEERAYANKLEKSEPISVAEKNAITKSAKLQKLLGIDPQHARLMRLLGATEEEIRETLEQYNNAILSSQSDDDEVDYEDVE